MINKTLIGMVVPAKANTSVTAQVLQKSCAVRTAGVVPVCSPDSEDDILGQV